MKHIQKCPKCEKYTMKEKCTCREITLTTKPPRYSPNKYAKYRRQARKEDLIEKKLF